MTTFEIAKNIHRIITTCAAESMLYGHWSKTFATKNLRDIPDRVRKCDWFLPIDPNDLSLHEMEALGFNLWSKETGLRLIPLWMHPFLSDMLMCMCIMDEAGPSMHARKDLDTDHRFGCLAYGVVKKEES